MSEANALELNRAAMEGAHENGGISTSAEGGGASDQGWEMVTNKKKLRRQASILAAAGAVKQAKSETGKNGVGIRSTISGDPGTSYRKWHKNKVPQKKALQAADLAAAGGAHSSKQDTVVNGVGMVKAIGGAGFASNHKLPQDEKRLEADKLAEVGGAHQRRDATIGGEGCTSNATYGCEKLPSVIKQRQQPKRSVQAGGAQHSGESVLHNCAGTKSGLNSNLFGEFRSDLRKISNEDVPADDAFSSCSCLKRLNQGDTLDGGCSSSICWRRGPFSFGST